MSAWHMQDGFTFIAASGQPLKNDTCGFSEIAANYRPQQRHDEQRQAAGERKIQFSQESSLRGCPETQAP